MSRIARKAVIKVAQAVEEGEVRTLAFTKAHPPSDSSGSLPWIENGVLQIPYASVPLLGRGAAAIMASPQSDSEEEMGSRVALMVNCENHTAWNVRRSLVDAGTLCPESEMSLFLHFVLSKHPKSAEAWAYRKWLFLRGTHDSLAHVLPLAALYPRNYYAWSYVHTLITTSPVSVVPVLAAWIEDGHRYGDGSALHALATAVCMEGGEGLVVEAVERACGWLEGEGRRKHESLWVHLKELGGRGGERVRNMVIDWIGLNWGAPPSPSSPSPSGSGGVEVYRDGYVFQVRTVCYLLRMGEPENMVVCKGEGEWGEGTFVVELEDVDGGVEVGLEKIVARVPDTKRLVFPVSSLERMGDLVPVRRQLATFAQSRPDLVLVIMT